MIQPIVFFAAGLPKGQPRPRAFARKFGERWQARVYDAGTAEGWKSEVAIAARQFIPQEPIAVPVSIALHFVMPRPRSHFRTGRHAAVLREDAPFYHTAKPDTDNLYKGTVDALTTLGFFRDDSYIVDQSVTKLYAWGARSGCRIEIKEAPRLAVDAFPEALSQIVAGI